MPNVSTELTLFGIGTSRTMRAHWMLSELGLEYESRPIQSRTGETLTDQFRRLNPRHKIPVLQHGSFVLTESCAIVQYLNDTFADRRALYVPEDAQARALLNEWCYFIMTELDATSLYVVRRHEGLSSIYGEAPAAVYSAKAYFLHNLETMAPRIANSRYLLGELLSPADILLITCLDWASVVGIALPQEAIDYRRRVAPRPAYQEALKRNFPSASKLTPWSE
jgi:glutathione S-transferase